MEGEYAPLCDDYNSSDVSFLITTGNMPQRPETGKYTLGWKCYATAQDMWFWVLQGRRFLLTDLFTLLVWKQVLSLSAPLLLLIDELQSALLHSQPKSTVGTPAYIAPKVLSRKEYDGKVRKDHSSSTSYSWDVDRLRHCIVFTLVWAEYTFYSAA